MNPEKHSLFERLKSNGLLPSPKGPAFAVVQLTRSDNVSFAQLAKAVNPDPALVARLLKLANGCRVAGSRPIVAIQDAVSMLGLTALRGLALGFSLLNDHRSGACSSFDYPIFWSKNLARAVAMQTLAGVTHVLPKEESFTLGLLAHMGELGLASAFPEEYSKLLENNFSSVEELSHQEVVLFKIEHAELTAAMLDDWGIPPVLVAPVRCHEKSLASGLETNSRSDRLILLLMLAGRIADLCLLPEDKRPSLVEELFLLGGKLQIDPVQLPGLCDSIVRDWGDWCQLLNVQPVSLPPFAELLNPSQIISDLDTEGATAPPVEKKIRVLVVEDDRTMQGLLKALLARIGPDLEYHSAANGREALDLATRERFHLMIVDWLMPEMNGIELVKELRKTEAGRGIYILIVTGVSQAASHQLEAFEAGADDFLTKPFNAKVLAARIRAGLRMITLTREIESSQTDLKRFADEFALLTKRLQDAGTIDYLTGALARNSALEGLKQTMHGLAHSKTIGAILIRLENLREINDTRGRQAGDEVLRQIATFLGEKLKPQEKIARYSGSCFLLVCPCDKKDYVAELVIKIKQAIAGRIFSFDGQQVSVAVSVGFALGHAVASEIDALLNEAEQALASTPAHDSRKSRTVGMMTPQKHNSGGA
ncbi:MAG: HDOD domain-containing protein [Betaproteobacteria bacterium]